MGPARSRFWGETITKNLPRAVVGPIADRLKVTFMKKFAVAQGTNVVGRLIPFGIGAVVGGGGNHLLGRQIVRTSREGFGPAPATFPEWLAIVPKAPKPPKQPKAVKPPREPRAVRAPRRSRRELPTPRD